MERDNEDFVCARSSHWVPPNCIHALGVLDFAGEGGVDTYLFAGIIMLPDTSLYVTRFRYDTRYEIVSLLRTPVFQISIVYHQSRHAPSGSPHLKLESTMPTISQISPRKPSVTRPTPAPQSAPSLSFSSRGRAGINRWTLAKKFLDPRRSICEY